MIKVTFEYATVDEAIVALAKLVGAPTSVSSVAKQGASPVAAAPQPSTRRGRSDKGQARGSYKNQAQTNANTANVPDATTVAATANGTGAVDTTGNAQSVPQASAGTTDPVATPTSTTPEPVVLAPNAPTYTQKDVQEAVSNVFKTKGLPVALQVLQRFGANTYRDVLPASYAEFIKHATFVSEGGAV